jgi:SP family xylose:H+ symportor-like MFS transporter
MYIAEIAPANRRGNLVTYYQLAIVIGFFVVFLVTYFIGNNLTENENLAFGWRHMFWSELIPSSLFLGALFFVPKSPRWLFLKGRNEEALGILNKIHGSKNALLEATEIKKSLDNEIKNTKGTVYTKNVIIIIIIGSVFSILQQFTGINAVLYY